MTMYVNYILITCVFFICGLDCLRNFFFFSSRRRHTRSYGDWSSDVCSSDLRAGGPCGRSRCWSEAQGPGRSARPRSGPAARRSCGSPRPGTVELGREIGARRLQDLVGAALLAVLAFQLSDTLML